MVTERIQWKMKLKLKTIQKGIKQQDFAKMLGITPQYLRKIEKGEVDIKRSFMLKASNILETSVEELFFNEEGEHE